MNRVLILGAGRGQIPIIKLCHSYGWEVVVASIKGNYPGFALADHVVNVDVRDKEKLLSLAKDFNVNAVLTEQLDEGVLTAAYISENLGLNGITSEVALKFTDKFEMRKAAKLAGINVPISVCSSDISDAIEQINNFKLNFPLMIKPVDSAASRGVHKVNNFEELKSLFTESINYSKAGKIIIEEFIQGKEFVVEAFTSNYHTTNLIVGHRDYFNVENAFIPNATVFVDAESANSPLEIRLKSVHKHLVEQFGLKFGITHGEYMYDEQTDKIYLVEVAARGGGVFIGSDLIPAACGINAEVELYS